MGTTSLEEFTFISGVGAESAKQACIMSAVAYVAGEPWGDHPECACRVLTEYAIRINDGPWWADNAERTAVLRPYVERLVGTRSTPDVERKRVDVLVNAALREFAPDALDHAARVLELAGLQSHADMLREHATKLRIAADAAAAAAYAAANAAYAADAAAAAAYAADAADNAAAYAADAAANAAAAANANANAADAADNAAAYAADAAAKSSSAAESEEARAQARRGVRARMLQLLDECIAIKEQPTAAAQEG